MALGLMIPALVLASLASDQAGMILLQVEENGEAWYVYPNDLERYYLGRPTDAFNIMRILGLGVAHPELEQYLISTFPSRLSGMIMLDVEQNGEAYYVYPKDLQGYYLGRPADAFRVMRELGLGISNLNLVQIPVSPDSVLTEFEQRRIDNPYYDIERRVFDIVNEHRASIGSKIVEWNDDIADISREHSVNMASGVIEPSHEGVFERIERMKVLIPEFNGGAENLAWNYSSDPALQGFNWWLTSEGHRTSLENDFYDISGVGVSRAADGKYFITQYFVNLDAVMMMTEDDL